MIQDCGPLRRLAIRYARRFVRRSPKIQKAYLGRGHPHVWARMGLLSVLSRYPPPHSPEGKYGSPPSPTPTRLNRIWELDRAEQSPYDTARRALSLVWSGLGDPDGAPHTHHSPKNPHRTEATQMNFETRERKVIGQWASNSRAVEVRDRSVSAHGLLHRNAADQEAVSRWEMAGSFRIPGSIDKVGGIGNGPA